MDQKTKDALRYMGIPQTACDEFKDQMADCFLRLEKLRPSFALWSSPIEHLDQGILISRFRILLEGKMAGRLLKNCDTIWIVACSLGWGFESELKRLSIADPSLALVYDACGSAYVEAVMEKQLEKFKEKEPGRSFTPCFSAGYGDLPLDLQKTLFEKLPVTKQTGIVLSDSMMMNPAKSITALVGLSDSHLQAMLSECGGCAFKEGCSLRKEGYSCAKTE